MSDMYMYVCTKSFLKTTTNSLCVCTHLANKVDSDSDMLPLSQIMRKNQIAYHSYADDTQIYLALSPNDYSPIDSLCQCIDEINSWMCQNFLQLNKEKTEVITFGNKDEVLKVNAYLDSRGQTTKIKIKILGMILETDLSFSKVSLFSFSYTKINPKCNWKPKYFYSCISHSMA